ncbi:MAG: helix-turn-helix transcriptional regulator [Longispora sp.]|nr:helix-turn-helix transcriptional regulator [Longispora sp. (in: high G+C Gram-positive bacteria)]
MSTGTLLERVRRAPGLSKTELARRAHTSRPTLSAYEHGHKSPTLATVERLLAEAGYELSAEPRLTFTEDQSSRKRPIAIPNRLPRLPIEQALALVKLPLHLNWSTPERTFDLGDRTLRAHVYEAVLREGTPQDIRTYIDGALLVDLWEELVLPRNIRTAWTPLVKAAA